MYIVFFSNGILPGANALAFETRTWEEVRDLSLNFLLVAHILDLSLLKYLIHTVIRIMSTYLFHALYVEL